MNESDILQILADTEALLSGHFELRSGLHSDRYFQCANLLRFPRLAERLCAELAKRLEAACPGLEIDGVISPAIGGILVGHEMGRALDKRHIFAEKADGALVLRRFRIRPGERYLVAEDVVTRGGRVQETIDIVKAAGGVPAAVAVLVDRSGGTAAFGCPFVSLLQMTPTVWAPADCPLCKQGGRSVHPGS
ncbi:MAG: orotate phosphoribosyltransferase [Kiritimatiellia bacterium]|jgi:orotate phosphoribosyltransferase